MPTSLDLLGERFGRLLVLAPAASVRSGQKPYTQWLCRCDCGKEVKTFTNGLRSGHAQSCGCRQADMQRSSVTKHGLSLSRTYRIWASMIQRCTNRKCAGYENYGGRGISVCDRWLTFAHFLADMGERPVGKSIDRIDNDGNYEPTNCRWATRADQDMNKRSNVLVTHKGRTLTITAWCRVLGLSHPTLKKRLRVFGTLEPLTQGDLSG